MRYVCLVYADERRIAALPREELDRLLAEHRAYDEDLVASGHWVVAEALEPVRTATTLRVRDGALSATDGPFAETHEQLGGFFLIEARDLNDALQVAARIPCARLGSVEVRPVSAREPHGGR